MPTFDNSVQSGYNVNNFTISCSGNNRRLYVNVYATTNVDPDTVTANGQALTKIAAQWFSTCGARVSRWRLIGSPSGTVTIQVTGGGVNTAIAEAWKDCRQDDALDPPAVMDGPSPNQSTYAPSMAAAGVPSVLAGVFVNECDGANGAWGGIAAGAGATVRQASDQRFVMASGATVADGNPVAIHVTSAYSGPWGSLLSMIPDVNAVAVNGSTPPPPPAPTGNGDAVTVTLTRARDNRVFALNPPAPLWILSGQSNAREVKPYLDVAASAAGATVIGWAEGGDTISVWAPTGVGYGWIAPMFGLLGVSAFIWWQGETDALQGLLGTYAASLADLIARVRTAAGNPHLPVIIVEGGHVSDETTLYAIQAAYVASDPYARLVDTADQPDNGGGHFFPAGYQVIVSRIVAALGTF